jgi:diguanylate cyclase (GGDEF)-like protein
MREGEKIIVVDLGSTNGTFVNGIKVDRKELADGDKIMVGSTTILKFTYHDYLDEVFQRQMYESALRDGLTKVFNKKYFTDYLEKEFAFAARHKGPLALIFLDIDHFKKINDTHGHAAGDQVLVALARCIESQLRSTDVVVRYGGEEFTVLLPDTPVAGGFVSAERLRAAIAAMTEREGLPPGLRITASIGVAAITSGDDGAQLIPRADAALYQAKRGGRNRVVTAPPPARAVAALTLVPVGAERLAS